MVKSSNRNVTTSAESNEAITPVIVKTQVLGSGDASPAFGKPADAATGEELAAQRESTGDQVVARNALESKLARLGYRSARQVSGSENQITIVNASVEDLRDAQLHVRTIGIAGGDKKRRIVEIDLARVDTLISELPTKTRVAGEAQPSDYSAITIYAVNAGIVQTGVNVLRSDEFARMTGDSGVINLASGVVLTVSTRNVLNSKGKPRRMFAVNVSYADSTHEAIESYWVQGLGDKLRARKLAITGDYSAS